ncbi:MAG: hypothetical protein ACI81P_001043 [Neolewinella sp.]
MRRTGIVNITQDACGKYFLLSGEVEGIGSDNDVDFTVRIGGIHEGEILFFHHNFAGERGVYQGVTPSPGSKKTSVGCTDLYGFDRDGEPRSRMRFERR